MSPSAITSTRVVLREGDRHVVKPACITLNGARIAAVLPHDEAPADALDLGDRLVAPSFIDVHTHLCLHGLRGAPLEDASGTNVVEQVFFHFESRLLLGGAARLFHPSPLIRSIHTGRSTLLHIRRIHVVPYGSYVY